MTNAIIKKLEAAINRALNLDPDALAALAELAGKVLAFEFINTGLVLFVFPAADGVRLDVEHTGEVTVTIRGTPVNMLAYLLSRSGSGEGFTGKMEVSGDVGLAQRFQKVVKDIDLDWEEVSRLGTVYSYAFVHRPQHPAFMDQVPIKLVAVRLDAGPLIVSSLVDEEAVDVAIGDRVEAVFEVFAAGVALPRFRMLPRDRRETSTVVW